MTTRKMNPSFLYGTRAPVRWMRAAAALIDDSVAALCARQWHGTQLALIPVRTTQARNSRR